jgi:hypothetical protein
MAKADTKNKEEKPKKAASKKTDESAGGKATKSKATANASSGASENAKAAKSSASSTESKAESAAKSDSATTAPAAESATKTDAESQSGAVAGALDSALLPALSGKVGVFGGPKDRGIKPDDKLALPTGRHFTFERVRSLNPKSFYCAMRWDYHVLGKSIGEGQRWWANKKLLVTNPANGNSVVVRAVDFGPPESTGLAIAISPGAAEALAVNVGDDVEIAFADPRLPMGVVE